MEAKVSKLPLYTRLGFAAIVAFGMVGNCAYPGDVRPSVVLAVVAIAWVNIRILLEGVASFRILQALKAAEKDGPKAP